MRHRDREQRNRQRDREPRVTAQAAGFVALRVRDRGKPCLASRRIVEYVGGDLVTGRPDRRRRAVRRGERGIEHDPRARQWEINFRARHARDSSYRTLPPAARRPRRSSPEQAGRWSRLACYGARVITTLRISGMTCNGCVKHVDQALRAIPGVSAVEVDLTAGRAHVIHESRQAPVTALVAAVERAGYDAADA